MLHVFKSLEHFVKVNIIDIMLDIIIIILDITIIIFVKVKS